MGDRIIIWFYDSIYDPTGISNKLKPTKLDQKIKLIQNLHEQKWPITHNLLTDGFEKSTFLI